MDCNIAFVTFYLWLSFLAKHAAGGACCAYKLICVLGFMQGNGIGHF